MMDKLHALRHSTSHVLAQAVLELYPKAKLGIGPVIDEGFYYDFDNLNIKEEDLAKIESKMQEIVNRDLKIVKKNVSRNEAKKIVKDQKYKMELIDELEGKISFYSQGDFIDLCKGPHVKSTGEIKAFKLMRIAGAYWKGDSKNKMLTRIYGTSFFDRKELRKYLAMLVEAEKRDHKKVGQEMELYALFDLIGRGLPVWLPKGEFIKRKIEEYAIELEEEAGFVRIATPHLAKKDLFLKSGHLPYYEETMYPKMEMDDGEYYLKAMNCPLHHLVFASKVRSYKDLPLRLAEYGTVYRNELSGTLAGLLRVRMLSMNDAHIYCSEDQIEKEVENVLRMIRDYFGLFGFKDYWFRLSLGDVKNKKKYINEPKNWKIAEEILRKVLKRLKLKFVEAEDEAAFYGPKIDVQFKNVYGREETMSTVQLDFAAKSRFGLCYDDKEGRKNKDVYVIHRAPLSTHERFMAFLIEHFSGKFPLWLSPEQVRVVTVSSKNNKYAKMVVDELRDNGFRVHLDERRESIGKKIRDGRLARANYILTIGDKEVEKKSISVRDRSGDTKFGVKLSGFVKDLIKEEEERR
tara:strand:+ start:3333 stop:5057 length:1725 start_codon:yes stop_codon:yes gene_type:complete